MRKKCSSALHKVLPVILCVLLFVCTIPLIAFADDLGFESGGGSSVVVVLAVFMMDCLPIFQQLRGQVI